MNTKTDSSIEIIEFRTIYEFCRYILNAEPTELFQKDQRSQVVSEYRTEFTGTETFEEAVDLLYNGWDVMSEHLTQSLKTEMDKIGDVMQYRNVLSVQGYHPIVPLYLNGIPANMVSRKLQPVKRRVLTINKNISYTSRVGAETIVKESVKALAIIQKLESQNYRCKLNIVCGTSEYPGGGGKRYILKICIKSPDERLNVSKLAFPLVHPSMLRRLYLRFVETYPGVPSAFFKTYGNALRNYNLKQLLEGEILLPTHIYKDISEIRSVDDLANIT